MAIMKTWTRAISVVLLSGALVACQTNGGPKQTGGALLGAGLGALAYYWVLERNPWLEMFPAT